MDRFRKIVILSLVFITVGCQSTTNMFKSDSLNSKYIDGFMTRSIDDDIKREAEGGKPNGSGTWADSWGRQIYHLGKEESGQRYIDYIVSERKRYGLPNLPKG